MRVALAPITLNTPNKKISKSSSSTPKNDFKSSSHEVSITPTILKTHNKRIERIDKKQHQQSHQQQQQQQQQKQDQQHYFYQAIDRIESIDRIARGLHQTTKNGQLNQKRGKYDDNTNETEKKSNLSITDFANFDKTDLNSPSNTTSNNSIDLAVSKLKLKLQIAIYKLKQDNQIKNKIRYQINSSRSFQNSKFQYEVGNYSMLQLPSPPPTKHYLSSININLKNQKPSLNKISKKKNYNLRLFQIKRDSSFYNLNPKVLPLVDSPPKPIHINHLQVNNNPFIHDDSFKDDCLNNGNNHGNLKNNSSLYLNPIYNRFHHHDHSQNIESLSTSHHTLPSINIILKTPIKNSKNYLSNKSLDLPRAQIVTDDTTIDEDGDQTIINNTTQDNSLSSIKDDSNNKILTSSPLHNSFATPNSFSVAKSLLQLGGHTFN